MATEADLLAYLQAQGIAFSTLGHPPLPTVEAARLHTAHLPGGHTKNLFLEDRGGGLWLVTCLDHQQVKVNGLARLLAAPRMSFAKADRMRAVLGVEPGSASPLALLNDRAHRVTPIWDVKLLAHDTINVHPLVNTTTVSMRSDGLRRFADATGHVPIMLDLDATLTA